MEDYPRTLAEFELRFATEAACRAYVAALRWPSGFQCRRCVGHTGGWMTKRGLMMCAQCGHQASVTAGPLFHRRHLPLRAWL